MIVGVKGGRGRAHEVCTWQACVRKQPGFVFFSVAQAIIWHEQIGRQLHEGRERHVTE